MPPLAVRRTITADVAASTPVRLSTRTVRVEAAARLWPASAATGGLKIQPPGPVTPAGDPPDGAGAGEVVDGAVPATSSGGGIAPPGCGSGTLFLQPSTAFTDGVGL